MKVKRGLNQGISGGHPKTSPARLSVFGFKLFSLIWIDCWGKPKAVWRSII